MPNGGSDCCGTCWFNSKNEEEAEYQDAEKEEIVKCIIRDIDIPNPFWTYCANHPHHNRDKIVLPLGPVYISDGGYPYARKVWKQPPDNENIRRKLLNILDKIDDRPKGIYPSETNLEEEVIKQITALKEKRALPRLLKISQLDISEYKETVSPIIQNKAVIVGQAIEALLEISEGEYIKEVKKFIKLGINERYMQEKDGLAVIRYHLIRGLQYCPQLEAEKLLQIGINDPHDEVKAFAIEIYNKRKNH